MCVRFQFFSTSGFSKIAERIGAIKFKSDSNLNGIVPLFQKRQSILKKITAKTRRSAEV